METNSQHRQAYVIPTLLGRLVPDFRSDRQGAEVAVDERERSADRHKMAAARVSRHAGLPNLA